MDWLFNAMPWWGWLAVAAAAGIGAMWLFGLKGLLAALAIGGALSVYAKGRKAGSTAERAKQEQADNKAREAIHDIKEDVRSIPDTPEGRAERDERFSRWEK